MTKQIEALKMAHKSFMQLNERHPRKDNGNGYFDEEIQACKEALEQPAQKPVAYCKHGVPKGVCTLGEKDCNPAPSWQGLSDDERYLNEGRSPEEIEYARAIEKALKEKNNG
jgi:hypothetical protein